MSNYNNKFVSLATTGKTTSSISKQHFMKKSTFITLFLCLFAGVQSYAANVYTVTSPDASLKAEVTLDKEITYSVFKGADCVLAPSEIAMQLSDGSVYDGSVRLRKVSRSSVDRVLPAICYKKSQVRENYNELTLSFKTFDLVFRAYDVGVAYRFVSKAKGAFNVVSETAEFAFPADWNIWVPYVSHHVETLETQLFNSFENHYVYGPLSGWNKDRLAFLPLMVESPQG